jgi:hypothetical protein
MMSGPKGKRRLDSTRAKPRSTTPIRDALLPASHLQALVQDYLGAVQGKHRGYIEESLRAEFADSLELDEAFRVGHDQENRWDYLLGHAPSDSVVAVEPHSATTGEISTVIDKRKAAKLQLRDHLKPGARIAAWLWVASGNVQFADTEKARVRLDQNGIAFVGRTVLRKHLPKEG